MADFANKRCPSCGKRPVDRRLVLCPDCKVAFEYDVVPTPGLTPAQMAVVARHVLGSWKLWAGLLLMVAAVGFGLVQFTRQQTTEALNRLDEGNSKRMTTFTDQISQQVSNRIVAEFQEPKIRAAMERVATERAGELLTNAVWGSLQSFRDSLTQAHVQLAKATNDLAALSNAVSMAQGTALQTAAAAADEAPMLRLVDQAVTQKDTNYVLTLFFRQTSRKPVGNVEIVAGTYRQTARILSFTARNVQQSDPPFFSDTADACRLKFTATDVNNPIILELELSAPTVVKLMGDSLEEEYTRPVAMEKMQIPVTGR